MCCDVFGELFDTIKGLAFFWTWFQPITIASYMTGYDTLFIISLWVPAIPLILLLSFLITCYVLGSTILLLKELLFKGSK